MNYRNKNMLLQIASDLHIEYKNDEVPDPFLYIKPTADILVLAGDIGSFYKIEQLITFLTLLCSKFKSVLYIPGNHEYYRIDGYEEKNLDVLLDDFVLATKNLENFYIMNRKSLQIEDICIVGCTLWSQPIIELPKYMVRIKYMDTRLYSTKHKEDLIFIKKAITYCKEKQLKLVVITHHAPTFDVTRSFSYKKKSFSSLYASNLNYLLTKEKVHTWICGHVHVNFDYITSEGTHLVGNQYGKPKDNIKDYNREKVIQI
jgi:predicted phosphohydrolase